MPWDKSVLLNSLLGVVVWNTEPTTWKTSNRIIHLGGIDGYFIHTHRHTRTHVLTNRYKKEAQSIR